MDLPFSVPKNYLEMLNKIAFYIFFGWLIAIYIVRIRLSAVDSLLAFSNLQVPIPQFPSLMIPLGTILPPFLIAFLSRLFRFHDRLSDLFRIRQRFDVDHILLPIATMVGARLSIDKIKALEVKRETLMNTVFYRYASSTEGKAVIDTHNIHMALDQWTWYWIVLEASTILFIVSLLFLFYDDIIAFSSCLVLILLIIMLLQFIRRLCVGYALDEINLITAQQERRDEILRQFDAL